MLLAFKFNMGLSGLWIGLTVGLLFVSVAVTTIILRLDWMREAQRAQDMLSRHSSYDQLGDYTALPDEVVSQE